MTVERNIYSQLVEGFGDKWTRFNQTQLTEQDRKEMLEGYFSIFPWHHLPEGCIGFYLGCGSGRWAKLVAPRVEQLHCIDLSATALGCAKNNLVSNTNFRFHVSGLDNIPLDEGVVSFGYYLGVRHHISDTASGVSSTRES